MRKASSMPLLSIHTFCSIQCLLTDIEGLDQTAHVRKLICAFAVRICPEIRFRMARPKSFKILSWSSVELDIIAMFISYSPRHEEDYWTYSINIAWNVQSYKILNMCSKEHTFLCKTMYHHEWLRGMNTLNPGSPIWVQRDNWLIDCVWV